jgi:hypothetical protein
MTDETVPQALSDFVETEMIEHVTRVEDYLAQARQAGAPLSVSDDNGQVYINIVPLLLLQQEYGQIGQVFALAGEVEAMNVIADVISTLAVLSDAAYKFIGVDPNAD